MRRCPHCQRWELSDRERDQILEIQALGQVTSSRLSKRFKLSVQNASNRLRKWQLAGYLQRREVVATGGGIEHVYSLAKVPE